MGEYTEDNISYFQGRLEGLIIGIARHTVGDKEFDQAHWEGLYGTTLVYDNLPMYPSEEAARNDDPVPSIIDWDDETETKSLKHDVAVPRDRPGTLVFEDGTVIRTGSEEPLMFTLSQRDTALVETWAEHLLEVIRDVYDYDPDSK